MHCTEACIGVLYQHEYEHAVVHKLVSNSKTKTEGSTRTMHSLLVCAFSVACIFVSGKYLFFGHPEFTLEEWFLNFLSHLHFTNVNIFILPPTIFSVSRHEFSEKGWGRLRWKNVVNLHSDTWIFVFTGTNFRVMLVRNLSVSEMKL